MIIKDNSMYVIKGSKWNIAVSIIAALFSVVALFALCHTIFIQLREKIFDIMPIGFLLLYFVLATAMSIYGFYLYSKEFIIDSHGIQYRDCRKYIIHSWDEIKDYGLSFNCISRDDGNSYDLYFSLHELKTLSIYRKNITVDVMRTRISGDDYYTVLREILPFCQKYTSVEPFISEK